MRRSPLVLKMVDYAAASFLSRVTFSWVTPTYNALRKVKHIAASDIPDIAPWLKSEYNTNEIKVQWARELTTKQPSFWEAAKRTYGKLVVTKGIVYCLSSLLQLCVSLLIGVVVRFVKSNDPLYYGLLYSLAFLVASVLVVVCHHYHMNEMYTIFLRCKVGCLGLLYEKVRKIEFTHLSSSSVTGKITNIANIDLDKMERLVCANALWIAPFFMLCNLGIQYWQLGVSGVLGTLVIIMGMPVQMKLGKVYMQLRRTAAGITDQRVKLLSQLIEGIRVLKMHVWEAPYMALVTSLRSKEIKTKAWRGSVSGLNLSIFFCTQAIASLVAFGSHVHMGNTLTADAVFTCVSLFVSAQFYSMYLFPYAIEFFSEFRITCGRIQDILLEHENVATPSSPDSSVTFSLLSASWSPPSLPKYPETEAGKPLKSSPFELSDVHFTIPAGQLCVVVGPVASGKSSLLMAALGELPYIEGSLSRPGKISYFSQEPWILSSTVKDNIVLGRDFDLDRYSAVVQMCSLQPDIDTFPQGDQTEIGERGVNISGGQKARIALARAVYSNADLYLFDDPLSAVDAIVSANVMKKCVLGFLAGKTRILVTHQVKYAQFADCVVVMDGGKVVSCGSYHDVERFFPSVELQAIPVQPPDKAVANSVFQTEDRSLGNIPWSTYYRYLVAGFGCGFSLVLMFVVYCGVQVLYLMVFQWLSYWTAQSDQQSSVYINTFIGIVFGLIVASSLRNQTVLLCAIRAAKVLHQKIFTALLNTPIEFFDWNPTGVILNRFSKDIGMLDETLGLTICDTFQAMFIALGSVAIIVYMNPYMLIALAAVLLYFILLLRGVLPVTRDVKRLEAVMRSPVFSLLSSTLPGVVTVRAMGLGDMIQRRFWDTLDNNLVPLFWYFNLFRWMSLRIDVSASVFTSVNVLLAVILRSYVNSSDIALSLSFTLQLVSYVIWTVKRALETDMGMVSAQRVMQYTDLPQERDPPNCASFHIADGHIEFQSVVMKYRADFDPTLKGVTCVFPARNKVAVVGRTGSGKSSLIQCLFRFRTLDSGTVVIDGRDIATIPLAQLRRQISVLPQTPFIFSATIRVNLDPFCERTDAEVMRALALVQLERYVCGLAGGVDTQLDSAHAALSAGQKQLLCMARVILANNRILILDEATANVDLETDKVIQQMLRTHFLEQTIITVAHRIDTVLDYDQIVVMKDGEVAEIGPPDELRTSGGLFEALVKEGSNKTENSE